MKGLAIALQFMTRLPVPALASVSEAEFAAAVRWFPATGFAVGTAVAGAGAAGSLIGPWLGALAATAAWVGITGALHLDGLADIADASGAAHRDPQKFLQVMADPHIGTFGVSALVLQLMAKLILLQSAVVAGSWLALILIPFAARLGIPFWLNGLPSLRPGVAARFRGRIRIGDVAAWAVLLVPAIWLVPALASAPALIGLWWLWLKKRIRGVSGDCLGAGVELVETGLLVALVVVARLA